MRVLVIGGSRFVGPFVVKRLVEGGHDVTLFNRGRRAAPPGAKHVEGDRRDFRAFRDELGRLAPDVVIDMIAFTEAEALAVMDVLGGVARRAVVVSSQDVYLAYDGLRGVYGGPPGAVPIGEDAPLREGLYPYRREASGPDDFRFDYEKILVERVYQGDPRTPGTVLRLPAVFGPGDDQHRLHEHLKRMDDGRRAILLGERRARWRWTRGYVEDVAAAVALASTDERAAGRTYNVGEREAQTEARWVRSLGWAAGWSGDVVTVPEDRLPAHLRSPMNWEHDLWADTGRIREEFGFAEALPRAEALRRSVDWERANPPEAHPAAFDYTSEDAALRA